MTRKTLIYFYLLFCNYLFAGESDTLYFEWLGDSINGVYHEKTAMIIPVSFENDTNKYYFQFDTGANVSSIYQGRENNSNLAFPIINSTRIKTNIGEVNFDTISYMSPFTEQNKLVLGTIGADVLKNKIVQIDYQKQEIIFIDKADTNLFEFHPMNLSHGRPVLGIVADERRYSFIFDTGSSLFELWTTKKTWKKFAFKNSPVNEFTIWSWGQLSTIYSAPVIYDYSLFKCKEINLNSVCYSSNKKHDKIFKQAKVNGVIGNKPFLRTVLVLDFKTERFGIKKCT